MSCITCAQLYVAGGKKPGETLALGLSEDPLLLRAANGDRLQLLLAHQFRLVEDQPSGWRVSTVAYDYRLNDGGGKEILSWHWHPAPMKGPDHPHLHVAAAKPGRHAHLPTGRVSIESVLRLLLTDLGVPPTHDHESDYVDVLDASERDFIEYRSWHS